MSFLKSEDEKDICKKPNAPITNILEEKKRE